MPLEHVNLARGKDGAAASSEKFTATPDEIRAIEEKMKDPVFVQLMHEYMQSLEDPETRREEEAYLEQAEREAREGGDFSFEFVFPRPAYVVELLEPSHTRISATEARQHGVAATAADVAAHAARSFLNVCHSEKVKAFTEHTTGNAQGSNWEVPVSVSQRRVELYNAVPATPSTVIPAEYASISSSSSSSSSNASTLSQLCVVHDVVFHPSTLALAERSTKFMCFLTEIAVEHINSGYAESNGFKFRRLPGSVLSIGTPQNQTLRTQKGKSPFEANPRDAVLQGPTKHLPAPVAPSPAAPSTTSPTPAMTTAAAEAPSHQLPPHTITHRGSIDLTDAWRWSVLDKRIGVPEELVVKLTFPGVRRAAALDIAITPDGQSVRIDKTEGQTQFEGLLVLPFTVEEVPTQAQFDRARGVLTLTLKVVPPPLPDGVASAEEVRKTLPGAVSGGPVEVEAPEAESPALPDTVETRTECDAEPAAIYASTPVESEKDNAQEHKEKSLDADTFEVPPPEKETDAAPVAPGKAEVAHIGDQDRVAAMMAQVAAARAARAAAEEKAAEAPAADVEQKKREKEVAKAEAELPPQTAVPAEDGAIESKNDNGVGIHDRTGNMVAADETAPAQVASAAADAAPAPETNAEEIPFLRKSSAAADGANSSSFSPAEALRHINGAATVSGDNPAGDGGDVEAVRARQQAWASMMEAEMQVAKAREEAEAAEAARAAEVVAARARRKLAAEKEQERLEQLAQAKRNTVPLSNKYIFSID